MFQAETFNEAVNLDGVILTKADSSAKGGVVFALASKLALPVLYVCNGEKYENLQQFNADDYIEDFLGSSTV
jgi:fused signal recognition particle receptor